MFMIVDVLQGANWQRSGKKSGQPKPFYERLRAAARQRTAADRAQLTPEQLLELMRADPALTDDEREKLG